MSGSVEDPSLSARLSAKLVEIASSKFEDLTVADRLTRRALNQRMVIDLGDKDDPIPIEIRVPTSAELERIANTKGRLGSGATPEEKDEARQEMIETIAGICIDPSLDVEFWQSGLYPIESMLMITQATNDDAIERIRSAGRFRAEAGGTGPVRAVQSPRKTTARARKL